ncbi:MAG: AraC family transcriptional regulator [Victivallaceae bacterium]|nr:AraC family transcriptional regulator [Victivallaceae bacterium]
MLQNHSNYEYAPIKLSETNPIAFEFYKVPFEEEKNLHIHDHLEIGYCRKGKGIFIIEDKVLPFQTGDICVLNEFEFHRAHSTGDELSEWYFMYFSPLALFDGLSDHDRYLDSSLLGGGSYRNIRDGAKYPFLRALVEVLIDELRCRKEGWRFSCNSLLRSIMVMLCRDRENRETPAVNIEPHRHDVQRLAPALQRISAGYAGKLTVSELARLCCMSNCTFYRIFSKTFNKSPQRYLIQYRMQMGAYLLRHRNIGVQEAALAVGYDSTSSFHRHFRGIYGVSPHAYKLGVE